MSTHDRVEFQQRLAKIEGLIEMIDSIEDQATQASVKELLQLVMDLHGAGIERMLDVLYESEGAGQATIDELARDDLIGNLLLLHGLHPYDLETRVRQALEKVRPYMRSHGGNVEFLGVDESGVVRLRLQGSCHECPSSRVTLKYAVEDAIYAAAPDVTGIEAEGAVEPSLPAAGFVPMSDIFVSSGPFNGDGDGWVAIDGAASLPENALRETDTLGVRVLLARLEGSYYAYASACPHCGASLGQSRLDGSDLICPTCGHRYDLVHAGNDRGDSRAHLAPLPLLQDGGRVRIALSAIEGAGKRSALGAGLSAGEAGLADIPLRM